MRGKDLCRLRCCWIRFFLFFLLGSVGVFPLRFGFSHGRFGIAKVASCIVFCVSLSNARKLTYLFLVIDLPRLGLCCFTSPSRFTPPDWPDTLHGHVRPVQAITDTRQQQRWQRTRCHQPSADSSSIYPLTH